MSEGFEENAEFFTLTYEAEKSVSHNLAFVHIAPLLWLRAGACGKRIDKLPAKGWAVTDAYGLLSAMDQATPSLKPLAMPVTCAWPSSSPTMIVTSKLSPDVYQKALSLCVCTNRT